MVNLATLLSCLLLPSLCLATLLQGRLDINSTLEIDAKAILTTAETLKAVPILEDNSFAFKVDPGNYVLRIQSRKLSFQTYYVKVPAEETESPKAFVFLFGFGQAGYEAAEALPPLPYPLVLPTLGPIVYVEPPQAFDIVKIVKGNPLILVLLVGALMSFGLPKLMQMVDPEALEEAARTQSEMHSKMASFKDIGSAESISKYLAGSSAPGVSDAPTAPPAKPSGKGAKKRK